MSLNLKRRHMTESQRGAVALELANMKRGRPSTENVGIPTISQSDAASLLNVSRDTVATAAKISRDAPAEIFEAVKAGTSERGEPEGAADD